MALYEFADGSRYELDLSNPEHRAWMEKRAGAGVPPAERSASGELSRQLGLTLRAGAKGLASLPGLVIDPLMSLSNTVTGSKFPTTAGSMDWTLSRLGVPEPQSGAERVVQEAASALAGTGGLVKGSELAARGATPAVQAILQGLQSAPRTQIASSALSGGAAGAAREGEAGPVAQTAAALTGGLIPGVAAAGAEPLRRIGARLVEPLTSAGREAVKGRLIRSAAGDRLEAISEALANPATKVQGSVYDAALAATPAGSAEFSALARALQKRFTPSALADMEAQNAAARLGEVQNIAGGPEALQAAKDLRSSTAAMTYPQAFNKQIPVTPELAVLMRNPFIQQAVAESADLSRAQGLNWKDNLTAMLQNVKFGLDKMVAGQGKTTLGAAEQREALKAQKGLVDWLERANPAYRVARENFAQQSVPINRMEIGQYLADKLAAPLGSAERPAAFAQALRDASGTVKRATGNPRYESIAQALLPKQTGALRRVQDELERERDLAQLVSRGESRARDILGQGMEQFEPPGLLNRGITILRAVMERVQKGTSQKTLEELAVDFQSPERIREILANTPKGELPGVLAVIKQLTTGSALGTGVGAKQGE